MTGHVPARDQRPHGDGELDLAVFEGASSGAGRRQHREAGGSSKSTTRGQSSSTKTPGGPFASARRRGGAQRSAVADPCQAVLLSSMSGERVTDATSCLTEQRVTPCQSPRGVAVRRSRRQPTAVSGRERPATGRWMAGSRATDVRRAPRARCGAGRTQQMNLLSQLSKLARESGVLTKTSSMREAKPSVPEPLNGYPAYDLGFAAAHQIRRSVTRGTNRSTAASRDRAMMGFTGDVWTAHAGAPRPSQGLGNEESDPGVIGKGRRETR